MNKGEIVEFSEMASIRGIPVKLFGGEGIQFIVDGVVQGGINADDIERDILPYTNKDQEFEFHGLAKWRRHASGKWQLLEFVVKSFSALRDDTLHGVIERMHRLAPTDWENLHDIDQYINRERYE